MLPMGNIGDRNSVQSCIRFIVVSLRLDAGILAAHSLKVRLTAGLRVLMTFSDAPCPALSMTSHKFTLTLSGGWVRSTSIEMRYESCPSA